MIHRRAVNRPARSQGAVFHGTAPGAFFNG